MGIIRGVSESGRKKNRPIHVFLLAAASCFIAGCDGPAASPDAENDPADVADGVDECGPGETPCGGECVDILANHEHCGGCDNGCDAVEACYMGDCVVECPGGLEVCGGLCVDVRSDPENCGGCGEICEAGPNAEPVCEAGACDVRCHEGWSDMDGDGSCETNCVPTGEDDTCDGVDDDCNGTVDDGVRVTTVEETYDEMSDFDAGCSRSAGGELFGLHCNGAIHNYCRALGDCYPSGFGPVENTGVVMILACVADAVLVDVTFAELTAQIPPLTCPSDPGVSWECSSAASRTCEDLGHVSGFGPVTASGENAKVACVSDAVRINTTYTLLKTIVAECDDVLGEVWGPYCNAAINRFCSDEGHRTGFGPVEVDVGTHSLTVVCVPE